MFGGRRVFTRRAEALCRAPLLRYPRYPLLRYPRYARAPRYICTLCPADFSVAKNAAGSLLYACARYIPARCPPACETRVNEWRIEGRVIGARSCLKICTRSRLSCTSARRHAQLCGQDSQLVLSSSRGFLLSLCRLAVNCRDLLLVL